MDPVFKRKGTITDFSNDKEKDEKLNKINELLTAAGYARARLPNLEPLDKILGGITWSLTSCFVDVEFEFKEEMSIGEKIKVSEKITKALKKANCPIIINPVQLQGLDLGAIFPLIQWLVKNMHETQDQKNEQIRKIALTYTKVNFESTKKKTKNDNDSKFDLFADKFNSIKYDYLISGRKFRAVNAKSTLPYNDELRVYLTLLEYGMKNDISFMKSFIELLKKKNMIKGNSVNTQVPQSNLSNQLSEKITLDQNEGSDVFSNRQKSQTISNNFKLGNPLTSKISDPLQVSDSKEGKDNTVNVKERSRGFSITQSTNVEISEGEKNEVDLILSSSEYGVHKIEDSNNNKIQASILDEILNNNLDSVLAEIEKFEEEKNDSFDKLKFMVKEKERLNNVKLNILKQNESYQTEFDALNSDYKLISNKLSQLTSQCDSVQEEIRKNETQLLKLENKIKESNFSKEKFELITEKIEQKEALKEEITKLKAYCKEERVKLEQKLEAMHKKKEKMNSDENVQVFDEIDQNYNTELNNLLTKKQSLFEENRVINVLLRKIQVNPSKLELLQYQKRFEELYEQINIVNEKNRELINEINSKEEVKMLLQQKLQTFVDLKEVYTNLKSKKDKENFKKTLEDVFNNVLESSKKSSIKPGNLGKELETLKEKVIVHQEYEQKYMKLVKEYNREYNKLYSK